MMLIDFEFFCFDDPEWDLMVTAVERHSLGWQTDQRRTHLGPGLLVEAGPESRSTAGGSE
ncbi:hypothetical protein [Streptomyces sp. NPDC017958]|uniref:hypothetical protein n=1 Tax=Streptomyces sp. NPDC017958 TaxID=3365021 RepID=UPI00378D7EEA